MSYRRNIYVKKLKNQLNFQRGILFLSLLLIIFAGCHGKNNDKITIHYKEGAYRINDFEILISNDKEDYIVSGGGKYYGVSDIYTRTFLMPELIKEGAPPSKSWLLTFHNGSSKFYNLEKYSVVMDIDKTQEHYNSFLYGGGDFGHFYFGEVTFENNKLTFETRKQRNKLDSLFEYYDGSLLSFDSLIDINNPEKYNLSWLANLNLPTLWNKYFTVGILVITKESGNIFSELLPKWYTVYSKKVTVSYFHNFTDDKYAGAISTAIPRVTDDEKFDYYNNNKCLLGLFGVETIINKKGKIIVIAEDDNYNVPYLYFVKINLDGTPVFEKTYKEIGEFNPVEIHEVDDGYVIIGYKKTVKINDSGGVVWYRNILDNNLFKKEIPQGNKFYLTSFAKTENGFVYSGVFYPWFLLDELDPGNYQSCKYIEGAYIYTYYSSDLLNQEKAMNKFNFYYNNPVTSYILWSNNDGIITKVEKIPSDNLFVTKLKTYSSNIYLSGSKWKINNEVLKNKDTYYFDFGVSILNFIPPFYMEPELMKLDSRGNVLWDKQISIPVKTRMVYPAEATTPREW